MSKEKKYPAMLVYVQDFVADPKVAVMEPDEIGAYWLLLCYCWIDGYLPKDERILKKLSRSGRKWGRIRDAVLCRFIEVEDPDLGLVYTHKRQEENLRNLREKSQLRRSAALQRWEKSDANASGLHMQNDASSSSIAIASNSTKKGQGVLKIRPEKKAFELHNQIDEALAKYGAPKRHSHGGLYHMMCQFLPASMIELSLARVCDMQLEILAGRKGDRDLHKYFIGTVRGKCREENIQSPIKWKGT